MRAAVGRYGTGGTFWREHPDMPRLPVTDWQVWNEPNSPLFWKPKPDAAAYLELLRGFDSAARGADPQARDRARRPLPHPARRNHDGRLHDGALPRRRPRTCSTLRRSTHTPRTQRTRSRRPQSCGASWTAPATQTAGSGSARWAGPPAASRRGSPSGREGQADYLTQTFELAAQEPRAARAGRRDLVLAERHAGPALAGALRALRAERVRETGLGRVRRPDRRKRLELLGDPRRLAIEVPGPEHTGRQKQAKGG